MSDLCMSLTIFFIGVIILIISLIAPAIAYASLNWKNVLGDKLEKGTEFQVDLDNIGAENVNDYIGDNYHNKIELINEANGETMVIEQAEDISLADANNNGFHDIQFEINGEDDYFVVDLTAEDATDATLADAKTATQDELLAKHDAANNHTPTTIQVNGEHFEFVAVDAQGEIVLGEPEVGELSELSETAKSTQLTLANEYYVDEHGSLIMGKEGVLEVDPKVQAPDGAEEVKFGDNDGRKVTLHGQEYEVNEIGKQEQFEHDVFTQIHAPRLAVAGMAVGGVGIIAGAYAVAKSSRRRRLTVMERLLTKIQC